MADGNSSKPVGTIVVTGAISGLFSAALMFIGVWFTAVQGQKEENAELRVAQAESRVDRIQIHNELSRVITAINVLQSDRYNQGIQAAELRAGIQAEQQGIRQELANIRIILERIEQRRGLP